LLKTKNKKQRVIFQKTFKNNSKKGKKKKGSIICLSKKRVSERVKKKEV